MGPERPDLRPDRPDFKPERPDLRPERPDGGDGQTEEQRTNKSSPVFYRTLSPLGLLPKNMVIDGFFLYHLLLSYNITNINRNGKLSNLI